MRVIYKNGFWEEYSKHDKTGFGIRNVVYPDGQKFTWELYANGWNAAGEETYAIQNKTIPYLLGDNKMKEYKFVTKDGSFNIIDLRSNHNEESFSSSSKESSDSDSNY